MKIVRWDHLHSHESISLFDHFWSKKKGSALTIGGFDGPHRGHEELFHSVLDASSKMSLASGVVTFSSSPGRLKHPSTYPGDVSTLNLRLQRLESLGFDFVILIDFSPEFGKMTGGDFLDILVNTVRMKYLAVGPDFRCGHRLDTGVSEIEALSHINGFRFDSIKRIELNGMRISSSAIRTAVSDADFTLAKTLLGHPFLLDLNEVIWASGESGPVASRAAITQILPRWGVYTVMIHTRSGAFVPADLKIEGDTLCLIPKDRAADSPISGVMTAEFQVLR